MPTPPIAIPARQRLVYVIADTFAASGSSINGYPPGTASITSDTGAGGLSFSWPLAQQSFTGSWTHFVIPPILTTPGIVINSIIPCISLNGVCNSSSFIVHIGESGTSGGGLVPGTTGAFNFDFYTASIGTNLATINTLNHNMFGECTLPIGGINDYLNITFLAFAVYFSLDYNPVEANIHIGVG